MRLSGVPSRRFFPGLDADGTQPPSKLNSGHGEGKLAVRPVVRDQAYTRHRDEQLAHGLGAPAKGVFWLFSSCISRGGVAPQGAQDVSAMTWDVDGLCVLHNQAPGRPCYSRLEEGWASECAGGGHSPFLHLFCLSYL